MRGHIPENTRQAMDHQQQHGRPDLQGVGDEHVSPSGRTQHEKHHANLDQPPGVVAIGERTGRQREDQERDPMRDDCKAAQHRRIEFLEHDPVTHHMLDVIGHHGQQKAHHHALVLRQAQGFEGRVGLCRGCVHEDDRGLTRWPPRRARATAHYHRQSPWDLVSRTSTVHTITAVLATIGGQVACQLSTPFASDPYDPPTMGGFLRSVVNGGTGGR